jgi:hypothetical protein
MPTFKAGQTIATQAPTIVVDPGLRPGRHRFQLEVFDAAGNRSKPATAVVEVQPAPARKG